MAMDRAVLVSNSKGKVPPTIRFYRWQPSAISIGYFQCLEEEVDLDICKDLGVNYVRRITGGGAVYHDKELTYSIVISESHIKIPKNIMESYRIICRAIIKGLKKLGIESTYIPINDIITNGKKISGNAQTRKAKTVLQHGTILIDVNVEKMFNLLRVPNEKIKDKLIADVKERVTSLKHVLDKEISFKEISNAIKTGFEQEFNIELVKGTLTKEEEELTKKFEEECFSTKDWNHRR
jgi:lipoate-protein ligase A